MTKKPFRVVIVGGGVGGLTLANVLERLGIDYVLLESHHTISPQVGASISMSPNGSRILEQLGCKDGFIQDVPGVRRTWVTRQGKPVFAFDSWGSIIEQSYGNGVYFNERQVLLRVLYDNLKNKDNIRVGKRVERVSTNDSCATVETNDHDTFRGDIVVGVDGIQSKVREEMWRNAAETSPGYFPKDEMQDVSIKYKCVFGISKSHSCVRGDTAISVCYPGRSYLLLGGPADKVYYFLFLNLERTLSGHETPRYSQDDARQMVTQYRDDVLIGDCTFGQIFDRSISFGMTPIHEHVFAKWHFGRIITLGDAAHKPDPILGHGGNAAMESVVALANQIKRHLDGLTASETLSAVDIDAIFKKTQSIRYERAVAIVKASHTDQSMKTMDGKINSFLTRVISRLVSPAKILESLHILLEDAVRIEALPTLPHQTVNPFVDELPARPLREALIPSRLITGLVLVALIYLAGHGFEEAKPPPESFLGNPFRMAFAGKNVLNKILGISTRCFSLLVSSPELEKRVQVIYFLPMLVPVVLIWLVEAHRRANLQTWRGSLLVWPWIYVIAYQLRGIALVAPVYFLISLIISSNPLYHRVSSRPVDPDVARALLPSVFLSYVIPTVLVLVLPLWSRSGLWPNLVALWQFAPIATGAVVTVIAAVIRRSPTSAARKASAGVATTLYHADDVPYLSKAYQAVFFVCATVHVSTVLFTLWNPSTSMYRALLDVPPPWGTANGAENQQHLGTAVDTAVLFFRRSMVMYATSVVVWCLHTVFEMRRLGYVATGEACRAALAVPSALIMLGPGALYAGTWYWREKTIAGLARLDASKEKKHV